MMELENHKCYEPKTKAAALRQAVQYLNILQTKERKAENLNKNLEALKEKLRKMKEEISRLEENSKELSKDSQTYKERLSHLYSQFDLTEAEILEEKLRILKLNLEEAEALKSSGIKKLDSTFKD